MSDYVAARLVRYFFPSWDRSRVARLRGEFLPDDVAARRCGVTPDARRCQVLVSMAAWKANAKWFTALQDEDRRHIAIVDTF